MSTSPIPVLQTGPGVVAKGASSKATANPLTDSGNTSVEGKLLPEAPQGAGPVNGSSQDAGTSQDGGENSFAQQLQRAEQQRQEDAPVPPPVQGDVETTEAGQGDILEQMGSLIAAGETVEVTGVQPLQAAATNAGNAPVQAQVALPSQQAISAQQPMQATGINLPPSGQPLPPASAGGADSKLPTNAVAAQARQPNAVTDPLNTVANRPQFELPQQTELSRQPQVDVQTVKLESVLPGVAKGATSTESSSSTSFNPTGISLSAVTTPATAQATNGAALPEASLPRPVISMNTPLGQQGWAQEVGGHLRMMVNQGNQRAEIRLNPPELGSVEVKVVNDGERTNVTFFAQNGTTREALEAAMPRLREMFEESGLQLADANVSQQQSMAEERDAQGESGTGFGAGELSSEQEQSEVTRVVSSNSLVDYYI